MASKSKSVWTRIVVAAAARAGNEDDNWAKKYAEDLYEVKLTNGDNVFDYTKDPDFVYQIFNPDSIEDMNVFTKFNYTTEYTPKEAEFMITRALALSLYIHTRYENSFTVEYSVLYEQLENLDANYAREWIETIENAYKLKSGTEWELYINIDGELLDEYNVDELIQNDAAPIDTILAEIVSHEIQKIERLKEWESREDYWTALPELKIIVGNSVRNEELYLLQQQKMQGYPCRNCKSTDTNYVEVILRSADEPATIIVTCRSCSAQYKE